MIKTMDEETQIGHLVARLAAQYPGGLPSATVSEVVHELYGRFHGARVREFVPLFVERRARTRSTNSTSPTYRKSATLNQRLCSSWVSFGGGDEP